MPVSIQRYNQKGKRHPNDRIIFIKALPGPDHDTAEDFLSRIAAICKPIMESNSLSVMTLEEHEPNREFVGRNFNAGEVVQLVLKAPRTGNWLPFRCVQMVMMHELAHCKQMNHSRAFWAVRNGYADELRRLWSKNYTGDGLWGQGRPLYANQYAEQDMPDPSTLTEHLCGGTFRSRTRKRKRGGPKPQLSYAERKQRRIEKRFGLNGEALGSDEEVRIGLEKGSAKGKPRVAQSKRGRELRLQAALLRFQQQKSAEEIERERIEFNGDSEDASDEDDSDWDDALPEKSEDAVDHNGKKMLDRQGRGLVRICEDEDYTNDPDARNELSELGQIAVSAPPGDGITSKRKKTTGTAAASKVGARKKQGDAPRENALPKPLLPHTSKPSSSGTSAISTNTREGLRPGASEKSRPPEPTPSATESARHNSQVCTMCSLDNPPEQLTCFACANVLDTTRLTRYWHCKSEACQGSSYINSADVGRCGVCGSLKPD